MLFTGPNERLIQNATTGVMLAVLTLFSIVVALALIWIKVLKLPKGFHQSLYILHLRKEFFQQREFIRREKAIFSDILFHMVNSTLACLHLGLQISTLDHVTWKGDDANGSPVKNGYWLWRPHNASISSKSTHM